jgi:hypothetical protein
MTLHLTKNYFQFFILILFLSPTFLFSQNAPEIQTALQHLRMQRATLNLEEGDIEKYRISDFYKTQHNGVAHIYLLQQHEGLDVHNAMININVLPDGRLLNIGNRFIRNIAGKVNATQPSIERTDALQAVLFKFVDVENHVPEELEQRSSQHYIYNNQGLALDPISVKLMYALQEDQTVRLVWQVKLYQLDGQHAWDVQVDALSGNILNYYDEVIHCDFNHTHDNCPTGEHTHENKNKNQNQNNVITPPAPVMGNTYNVFPMPVESPNHGDRAMVVNPSDSTASPFGWHDVDGIDGEEYTITRGNNAHAYHDIFFQNAPIGGEPDGGALLEFDFPFDIDNDTVYQQLDAATVNLFYWNNICHDLWYHYGFDEASGNFQQNNYGNDGLGGDYVRAEAVDGIGSNNANFFTPNDGQLPRMQMFIWRGEDLPQGRNFLDVTFGSGSTENMVMRPASFGGQLPFTPIVGNVILVDDGVDTPTDACENIGNDDELVGRIALVDRGECSYGEQVLKAEQEGAVAVIVCNNDNNGASSITTMFPGAVGSQVTIPAVMISFQNCCVTFRNNSLKNFEK